MWTKQKPVINKPCIVLTRYENMTTATIIFDVLKDSKGKLYCIDAQGYVASLEDIHENFDYYCILDYPERSKK